MEIGIHTFGELVPDPHTGHRMSAQDRLRDVIRMAVLADEVGLDVFGFGEHHRRDFAASPPASLAIAVTVDAGFADQAHFSRLFKATFGLTPARYRALNLDVARSSTADCPGREVAPAPTGRVRDDSIDDVRARYAWYL